MNHWNKRCNMDAAIWAAIYRLQKTFQKLVECRFSLKVFKIFQGT